jgi:hypothetical protein
MVGACLAAQFLPSLADEFKQKVLENSPGALTTNPAGLNFSNEIAYRFKLVRR